jgi:hypothetical protein
MVLTAPPMAVHVSDNGIAPMPCCSYSNPPILERRKILVRQWLQHKLEATGSKHLFRQAKSIGEIVSISFITMRAVPLSRSPKSHERTYSNDTRAPTRAMVAPAHTHMFSK